MGNTTELERGDVKTEEKPEASQGEASAQRTETAWAESAAREASKEQSEGGGESGEFRTEGGSPLLNKGESRVVARLVRAKAVANLAAPELQPTLEDLVEIAELIEDEGG